jgi:hypothetical protein
MPKRLKKPAGPKKPRRPTDPNKAAQSLIGEHMRRVESAKKPWEASEEPPAIFDAQTVISEHMRKLGAKGGKVSGAKRMENLSKKARVAIAEKAAAARWKGHAKKAKP